MIEKDWTGKTWDLKKSILILRKMMTGDDIDIFTGRNGVKSADPKVQKVIGENDDVGSLKKEMRFLIENIALKLGADNNEQLKEDVENLIVFEEFLANVSETSMIKTFNIFH